jgi:hypothetical protein
MVKASENISKKRQSKTAPSHSAYHKRDEYVNEKTAINLVFCVLHGTFCVFLWSIPS